MITYLCSFIVFFVLNKTDDGKGKEVGAFIMLIVLVLFYAFVSIAILFNSAINIIIFWRERGIWKIMTLLIGVIMTILSITIALLSVLWIYEFINEMIGIIKEDKTNIIWDVFLGFTTSHSSFSISFRYYVIIFTFIVLWNALGLVYEFIKWIFSRRQNKQVEENENEIISN